MSKRDVTRTSTLLECMVLLGMVVGKMLGRAMLVEDRETVVVTVLQRVVVLPAVLLVIFSMAMDHGTEALEEVFEAPRFPRGSARQSRGRRDRGYALPDFAYPSVEQMAHHWFASHFANPSVETFAPPMSHW